ncbi:MAG: DsrE family protein [Candidatus Nezhaarchaeota archaeon]|nr:DsrE family protein [Candidatus Nezhaarchaeota archaeon]MCX8141573.1 DsrE family protein [Candidatus Nezhaarchaeota archaeon]MDW8049840.1 DsrE family protein [Nitrososphaerota archaeon]
MVSSITIVLTKSPYGDVDTIEGLRVASSLVAFGIETTVVFMDDAVLSLTKTHRPEGVGMLSIHGAIRALTGARILVHTPSLDERSLSREDLIEGVPFELINDDDLVEMIAKADITFTM